MKRIEFNIEKAKSGEYNIETRSRKPVRIICWDNDNTTYPIIGTVDGRPILYSLEGLCNNTQDLQAEDDLFLVEKNPPLNDFEKKLQAILKGVRNGYYEEEYENEFIDTVKDISEQIENQYASKVDTRGYIAKLKQLQTINDTEYAHIEADDVLTDLLNELGYNDILDEYSKVDKWYA